MENETKQTYSSQNLLVLLWKWRKVLIGVTLLAALVSAGISLTMDEYYKSVAIIFPAKSSSVTLRSNANEKDKLTEFGEEESAEQLLQILGSAEVRDKIISTYDLYDHYGVDSTEDFARTKVVKEYEGNISFERTKYGSIEIEVLDQDPEIAAAIANDIANYVDTVKNRMIRERMREPYQLGLKEYAAVDGEINTIIDKMLAFADSGVVTGQERPSLIDAKAEAMKNRDTEAIEELQRQIDINKRYGIIFDALSEQREEKIMRREEVKEILAQLQADANIRIAQKFPVEYATPAEKKSYPIRWLIVAVSTLGTFLFAAILILFLERLKQIRQQARIS